MAAYSLSDRSAPDSKCYRIYDPGAYQYDESYKEHAARVPFLSNTPRKTLSTVPIWTHAIYKANYPSKIPNCSSMMSKSPRFPYEALSKEDLEEILCKCGLPTSCECPTEENKAEPEVVCQGKVPKHIIKGVTPGAGSERLKHKASDESPPFYDARVIEATMFYQGCKWSKWSSSRATKPLEQCPGPADYTLDKQPTDIENCAEHFRAHRRKESKQYRFIEMVQRRNILENSPGPASYSPMLPKGTDIQEPGPKADRFPASKYEVCPGPADHNLKRDFEQFEPPETPITPCHAHLPAPPCFGMKAQRFKPRKEEGPSPASYCATYKPCQFQTCAKAPFGSNTERFKMVPLDDDESTCCADQEQSDINKDPCPRRTWEFKSKTLRLKPLLKCWDEPSPADFLPEAPKPKRPLHVQYLAPFGSSDGRLNPWHNYLSVFGTIVTPGPGYYNLEKFKCYPAVYRGPLFRARRFRSISSDTPAPNAYNVGGGIASVLDTHNKRLKNNIEKRDQYQYHHEVLPERKILTLEEKEALLINKCIALCDESMCEEFSAPPQDEKGNEKNKKKLLRFFLYTHQVPNCN